MEKSLTFTIGQANDAASMGLFAKAMVDIERLLRDVELAVHGPDARSTWRIVGLHSSAPTITVTPDREDQRAVAYIADGIRDIQEGTDEPPRGFSESVFEDLKRMQRLFRGKNGAKSIGVGVDGVTVASIESDISQRVSRVLSAGHHNLGTIQGHLDAINIHSSGRATVWDSTSRAPVRWSFQPEMLERVKQFLGHTVLVAGDIRYFANGIPRSISDVSDLEKVSVSSPGETSRFGSIPDQRVRERGAARLLEAIREGAGG